MGNGTFYGDGLIFSSVTALIVAFDKVERKPNFGCDFAELVALCRVRVWKTHIPVRTPKLPPRLVFAGAYHGIVINYGHG